MSEPKAVLTAEHGLAPWGRSTTFDNGQVRRSGSKRREVGLTIAIPNWNHRGFLPRSILSARAAIASIWEFGWPGEVLIIDDASRDGSGRLLRSLDGFYGWVDVSVVLLKENVGLPTVRNLALELTRFSHVLFLDADNEVIPTGVATLFRAALETGATHCYGNLLDIYEGEAVAIRSNEGPTLRLTATNYIDALALVDAQKALAIGGYARDRWLGGWEDWEFVLHMIAEESEMVFVPTIVGNYHILPFSMLAEKNKGPAPGERDVLNLLRRVYAQTGTREWDTERVGRVFHPDIGYLDEGWLFDGA